jgi:hypothetical protein
MLSLVLALPLGRAAPPPWAGRGLEGADAMSPGTHKSEGNSCVAHGTACCTNPKGLEFCVGTLVCKDGECSGFEQDKQQQGTQEKQQAAPGEGPRLAKTEAESQAATPPGKPEDIAITVCYDDGSDPAKGSRCGEEFSATCTGSDGGGECCSAGGFCGTECAGLQSEYSHGNNLCDDGMSSDGFVVPEDERIAAQQQQQQAAEAAKPASCLTDASVGSMQCGEGSGATCTGESMCCSAANSCGSGDAYCGEGMQEEYSNGKNLCPAVAAVGQQAVGQQAEAPKPHCITVQQVANAWVEGIAPISKADAKSMCVPAVIIAAGSSYNTPECEDKFDPLIEADGWEQKLEGLWQISENFFDSPDPKRQAKVAYEVYTGDNSSFGCLADWCITSQPGCSAVIPGIGQDDVGVTEKHRFCMGVWSGANTAVPLKLQAMGLAAGKESGMEVVETACKKAAIASGLTATDAWGRDEQAEAKRARGKRAADTRER